MQSFRSSPVPKSEFAGWTILPGAAEGRQIRENIPYFVQSATKDLSPVLGETQSIPNGANKQTDERKMQESQYPHTFRMHPSVEKDVVVGCNESEPTNGGPKAISSQIVRLPNLAPNIPEHTQKSAPDEKS